ncbi:hypothetical protein [Haloarchaeobius sp. HRN-SO-5]|uniref:hypothetical protein n=1 Tax=Haloarchaeobius sp. HRN-SO-5 TaxID=3446118 RepID=UPI003EBABCC6
MFRRFLAAIGILEILVPEAFIDAVQRLALENPDALEVRPSVITEARVEGVLYLFFAWRSDAGYSAFKKFLGLVGLTALVSPQYFVDAVARMAYADSENCEWRDGVYAAVRIVGVVYLLIALDEWKKNRSE